MKYLADEARTATAAGLALNPSFTIGRLRALQPSDNPMFLAGRERLYVGLRLAGVLEGDPWNLARSVRFSFPASYRFCFYRRAISSL
jgi:hypothetical protein